MLLNYPATERICDLEIYLCHELFVLSLHSDSDFALTPAEAQLHPKYSYTSSPSGISVFFLVELTGHPYLAEKTSSIWG